MRITVVAALASLGLGSGLADADVDGDVSAHVTAGQNLARTGDYTGAIREFEQADARSPRASHACLIGLAELRRHELGQAEVWFDRCRARATPSDPLPPWLATSTHELDAAVTALAPITIAVAPATPDTLISIDGWDAPFVPRLVHLAPGHYHVTARAPGTSTKAELEVTGTTAQTLTLLFSSVFPPPAGPPAPVVATVAPPPPTAHRAIYVVGAGVAALAAAGIVDVTAVRSASSTLQATTKGADYDQHFGAYRDARDLTVGLLAAGAITTAVGLVMHHREREADTAVRIGARVDRGGGLVTLEWAR